MGESFKFLLLTSDNPQGQYDSILEKDDMTFYLLKNGVGYLGTQKLFDANADKVIVSQSITEEDPSVTETASIKAIVDYVKSKVGLTTVLSSKFFRDVKSHTLTSEDLTNENIIKPDGAKENDVGLLFTSDIDSEDNDNEKYYFISLTEYIKNVYTFNNSNSINFSTQANNQISAELNIAPTETSLKSSSTGVYIEKLDAITESVPSGKLVTDTAIINYIKELMNTKITSFAVDSNNE